MKLEGPLLAVVMLFLAVLLGGTAGVVLYAWWAEINEWRKKYNEDGGQ